MEENIKTVVVKREDGIRNNTTATTPSTNIPNVLVKALSPLRVVLTRAARVYVQSLVGMLTVVMSGMAPDALIAPNDFGGKFMLAAGFAIAPAVVTLLQNTAELLIRLDETKPELRG